MRWWISRTPPSTARPPSPCWPRHAARARPAPNAWPGPCADDPTRDALYEGYGPIVELDGRLFRQGVAARVRDLRRDLAIAVHRSARTERLGYARMMREPCATASAVAMMLRQGGWSGALPRSSRRREAA
ncbi:hypothetical protein [Nocardioides acrostichi]|uniref:Uncharacterized protein n=1 Tax=Nocardioides acrostichi TaxID=2784339 RepID=A0A930YCZ7_9ACTN|nr:hypothetical protein [Nocardioides acrostichi]MBF4161949.1 hypothetical protein [Nocardioides acrostichi]